jgi:hypothetical protein
VLCCWASSKKDISFALRRGTIAQVTTRASTAKRLASAADGGWIAKKRERKLISIVKRLFSEPNPPARRLSVEGREELLLILGGRADERALARRSREAVEGKSRK